MHSPSFLIIGATKSGTTSLYHYMKQHPQIYMSPKKEPHFFAFEPGHIVTGAGPGDDLPAQTMFVTDAKAYRLLFEAADGALAKGEASAMYIYYPNAAERIKRAIPRVRLIAILRSPVQRAYSSYLHMIREGRETHKDFATALQAEDARIREGWLPLWHYKKMGFYHEQLQRYYALFDPSQIRVYLHEDFEADPVAVIKDIFGYLEVNSSFTPDMTVRHNISGMPKSPLVHKLHHFLKKPNQFKTSLKAFLPARLRHPLKIHLLAGLQTQNLYKPPLSEEVRHELLEAYRDDTLKLQDLLQRDLSKWLT